MLVFTEAHETDDSYRRELLRKLRGKKRASTVSQAFSLC